MHVRLLLLLLAAVALLASGCGSDGDTAAPEPAPAPSTAGTLSGEEALTGDWVLAGGTGIEPSEEFPVTLTFPAEKGLVAGSSACNRYNTTPTFDGDALALGPVAGTRRMCAPEAMTIETAYLLALQGVDTAVRDGNDLVLSGDDVELRFVPAT